MINDPIISAMENIARDDPDLVLAALPAIRRALDRLERRDGNAGRRYTIDDLIAEVKREIPDEDADGS